MEFGRIGVFGHHGFGGLLGEGLASAVEVGDVTDEFDSGVDGLSDHSADGSGTGRDKDGSDDGLTLDEAMGRVISSLESNRGEAALGRKYGAVDDSRAAGDSSDDSGEGRHVEKSQTLS